MSRLLETALPATSVPPATCSIARGSSEYRRAGIAFFMLGLASFSLIYCVQPLLPAFTHSFGVTPAQSSLALSLTTGLLAISILLAGAFSQAVGRRGLMFTSMALASICNFIAAVLPDWHMLLVARAVEGVVLGGVPAVAMAWLAEEIDKKDLGKTMGLYVGGTAFGAMVGRVGMGLLTEFTSWRIAMGVLGVLGMAAAIAFVLLLPESRNFERKPGLNLHFHFRAWFSHLGNKGLIRLYATGFFLTSVFVTLFNYATFRLSDAPFHFSQTQVSLIFCAYAIGIVSSSLSGSLADRFGRKPLLITGFLLLLAGILLTVPDNLLCLIGGIILITSGFFVAHAAASGSVGPLAGNNRGHASSLYLLFYYMGSSITGSFGGWFWLHGGWNAVVGLTVVMALAGLALSGLSRQKSAG
ncbi:MULTISPECIES: MFS transporter [Pantoea]|uniref:Membrane protein n=2 Tax=Pantoea TaxID=53335 RepID=A0A0U3UET9_9GAMM|nr:MULTISPECIES: MFS transporter [Pantoea]ALV92338.1 membrane protein [Pantoea vagans]KHJ69019.1 membrane protein [Pantoea rodasii]